MEDGIKFSIFILHENNYQAKQVFSFPLIYKSAVHACNELQWLGLEEKEAIKIVADVLVEIYFETAVSGT